MALAKKCDRCGKFYTHYEGIIDRRRCNAIKIVEGNSSDTCYFDRLTYDLCGDCLDSFSEWLHANGDAK